jgi:hypothetical protein
VNYSAGAEGLKIAVSKGFTLTLVAGPSGFDALSRLGLAAGALVNTSKTSSSSSSSTTSSPSHSSSNTPKQVFGLGLTGSLDISTALDAGATRAQLMNALSAIKNAYSTTNAPPASTAPAMTGTVSAQTQAQLANYNLALSLFQGGTSVTTAAPSSTTLATG